MKTIKNLALLVVSLVFLASCARDNNDPINEPGYKIVQYGDISENTQKPCFVNIMFQVTDMQNHGVSTLTTNDFEVLENGQPVSPTESAMQIRKQDVIPYSLKTVLLIDNSTSIEGDLTAIKNAARSLVLSKLPNQEFAIFVFSENPELLINFTTDTEALIDAIESIEPGFASTNLYGSVIEAVGMWEDFYEIDQIQQGFLITFTDGSDTQASSTLSETLLARGSKRVFMVGLGQEIDPATLEELGNAGYYTLEDVSELEAQFEEIQTRMAEFANSFYWLNYMTPKRGDNDHTLKLSIINNSNSGSDSYIEGTFNSAGFYSVQQGLYINASEENPYGISSLDMAAGDTARLEAITYLGSQAPNYDWVSSNIDTLEIVDTDEPGTYFVKVIAKGLPGQSAMITLRDLANGLTTNLSVHIIESNGTTEGLVSYYPFTEGDVVDNWGHADGVNFGATAAADVTGTANNALYFNGDAYVQVSPTPLTTGPKTISLMVSPEMLNQRQILIANSLDNSQNDDGFLVAINQQNTLEVTVGNGAESGYFISALSSRQFDLDNWYQVVVVFDGSTLTGFVNGEIWCSSASTTGQETLTSLSLRIGGPLQPVNTFFEGKLDEVRLYARALSEAEVRALSTNR